MEVTKWLKPSDSVSHVGDRASVQAVTRVNAEQTSKRTMCRPTRRPFRGRLTRLGENGAKECSQTLRRGNCASMFNQEAQATGMTKASIELRGPEPDDLSRRQAGRPGGSEGSGSVPMKARVECRWSRQWMGENLRLFNGYRVRRLPQQVVTGRIGPITLEVK